MADISEEELDWLADKLYSYGFKGDNFSIIKIEKHDIFGINFHIVFKYDGTEYGMRIVKNEQDKEQRTIRT